MSDSQHYVRSVPLEHHTNDIKIKEIEDFLRGIRSALAICKTNKINFLKTGQRLRRFLAKEWVIPCPEHVSSRVFKSVENVVDAGLKSWMERAVIEGRKVISTWKSLGLIDKETEIELYTINKWKLWWNSDTPELGLLLIDAILEKEKFPVFTSLSFTFDSIIAEINESDETEHDSWLTLTLFNKKKLDIPVEKTNYYHRRMSEGVECGTTQISLSDGGLKICRAVKKERSETREDGEDIYIDWGLHSLLALDDGRLLGLKLYPWLVERDRELLELERRLKSQGIKLKDSKRYIAMNKRIREYVKNEIGRIFNDLSEENIRSITVEDLDFRGKFGSKSLRRILNRAGRSAFKDKLKDLEQKHGIEIHKVNPAFTSQECSGCHLVRKESRKGQKYECIHCGKKIEANVNASRVMKHRRSMDSTGYLYVHKNELINTLDMQFEQLWNCPASRFVNRSYACAARLQGKLPVK